MRPRRWWRRSATALSGLLVLAAAGAWMRSCVYLDRLEYQFGELQGPGTTGPPPVGWEFHARAASAHHHSGAVLLALSRYISYADDCEALARQWADWRGWSWLSIPLGEVVIRWRDPWYYESPVEWRAGPLGFFSIAEKGEAARVLSIPYGLIMLVGGVPFWMALLRLRRMRRRRLAGRCVNCGYDLRGFPGGACSECGAVDDAAGRVATRSVDS
ncbi:MAG: hypothetical protein HRU75_08280 [Planctomycetia bacterium]|nr:MAG: hypothetical protein HRU75_08280 [Planctomycetia bacterium]